MDTRAAQRRIVIVGGGLAGLTAAATAARAGAAVTVLEKASTLGGRGATHHEGEFRVNLGPHALYRAGAGMRILGELGIAPKGAVPSASGNYASLAGRLRTLPAGALSLLTTGLLPLGAKLELARLLVKLPKLDAAAEDGVTVAEWTTRMLARPEARAFVLALLRVSTYANAPELQSAGVALAQLQLALKANVLYLDGGWQQLVTALAETAGAAGARIVTGVRVSELERAAGGVVTGVRCADGTRFPASAVIIATTPSAAAALAGPESSLARGLADKVPVRAACLDVGLSSLPRPRAGFALGIDAPTYVSVHSRTAALAPEGAALIHVAKYLAPDDDAKPAETEAELEAALELLQPGWRERVVFRRYLPRMVVAGALETAAAGGRAGRQPVAVADLPGVTLAGDWVGGEGLLADAAIASGREAARLALATSAGADGGRVAA